jgi:hypothetical protein
MTSDNSILLRNLKFWLNYALSELELSKKTLHKVRVEDTSISCLLSTET